MGLEVFFSSTYTKIVFKVCTACWKPSTEILILIHYMKYLISLVY